MINRLKNFGIVCHSLRLLFLFFLIVIKVTLRSGVACLFSEACVSLEVFSSTEVESFVGSLVVVSAESSVSLTLGLVWRSLQCCSDKGGGSVFSQMK